MFIADYRLLGPDLVRFYCQSGSSPSQTVVGRDIASAVADPPGTNPPPDAVIVHVQTTKAISGNATCTTDPDPQCYSFDVSASRRTPAFRIFVLPTIDANWIATWDSNPTDPGIVPIGGTAVPGSAVALTITDQANDQVNVGNLVANSSGSWEVDSGATFSTRSGGISRSAVWSTLHDGTITFAAQSGTSSATTSTIKVSPPTQPSVNTGGGRSGSPTYTVLGQVNVTFSSSGYPPPKFTEQGRLPANLVFTDNGNGTATLSGQLALNTGGTYTITVTAINSVGPSPPQTFTFTVQQSPAITSPPSTTFTVGTAGSFTVTATGYPAPTFSNVTGLPLGVTFDTTTGVLSGTPAAGTGGVYNLTFTARNGVDPRATQNFTLTVNQAPTITSPPATTFTAGTAGSFTVTTGGYPTPTLSESGTLPTGVTFNPANGVLSGTTTQSGAFPLTFTATNSSGTTTQSFTLTVS